MALQYKLAVLNYTTRFVDFADYMLHHGMTLFPIADDLKPYPDYTVANTVLIYLASLPFGHLSILSMGLPYSVAAALMLVATYKLGALHNKRWGLYAVLLSLLTWALLDGVGSYALDVYPALFAVSCFYWAYSADRKQDYSRLVLVFIGLALGFVFRGPIGLIGPAIVVANYYLLSRQWRALLLFSLFCGLIFIAGVVLLSWAAYVQGGTPFMRDVLEMQGLGRIASEHAPRYYFYFSAGLLTYGVTVFFALNVIVRHLRHFLRMPKTADVQLLLYLTAWFLTLIVFFTIPNSKKARYILLITPAISLLAAYIFIDPERLFARARNVLLGVCLNLPVISLGLLLATALYNTHAAQPLQPDAVGIISSVALLALVRYVISTRCSAHPHRELIILCYGVAAFFALNMFFFKAITYHLELPIEPTPKYLPYWFW